MEVKLFRQNFHKILLPNQKTNFRLLANLQLKTRIEVGVKNAFCKSICIVTHIHIRLNPRKMYQKCFNSDRYGYYQNRRTNMLLENYCW